MKLLFVAFVALGLITIASGWWCSGCCCVFCSCSKSSIDPIQLLAGESGATHIISESARLARSQQLGPSEYRLKAETFLEICDANGDASLSLEEFEGCLPSSDEDPSESFGILDTNANEGLALAELKRFEVNMQGRGDCYQDLSTRCAAQFVMYERVRGVTKRSLCGGLQLYHNCVEEAATKCDDPRTAKLESIFSWTQEQLGGICNQDGTSSTQTGAQRATLHCSANLIRALHGSQPPCVAMAIFTGCLKDQADAKQGEKIFEDVVQLAGCDKK